MKNKKRGLNNAFKNVVMPVKIDYINSNKEVLEKFYKSNAFINSCNACLVNILKQNIYKVEDIRITMIEHLEIQKEEQEIILQKIDNACKDIENKIENENDITLKEMFKTTLKNWNKDYEWNLQILEELNESIDFERNRVL